MKTSFIKLFFCISAFALFTHLIAANMVYAQSFMRYTTQGQKHDSGSVHKKNGLKQHYYNEFEADDSALNEQAEAALSDEHSAVDQLWDKYKALAAGTVSDDDGQSSVKAEAAATPENVLPDVKQHKAAGQRTIKEVSPEHIGGIKTMGEQSADTAPTNKSMKTSDRSVRTPSFVQINKGDVEMQETGHPSKPTMPEVPRPNMNNNSNNDTSSNDLPGKTGLAGIIEAYQSKKKERSSMQTIQVSEPD